METRRKNPAAVLFYLAGGVLIAFGIIMTIIVKTSYDANQSIRNNFIPVTANVTDRIYDSQNEYVKEIYVSYTVGEEEFENTRIILEHPSAYVSSLVTVYYDPGNPSVALPESSSSSIGFAYGIALFVVIGGFVLIVIGGTKSKSKAVSKIEERFRPYDEYEGGYTEKAGTLFDKEVNPEDLKLEKKKHSRRRERRRYGEELFDPFQKRDDKF